MAQKIVLYRIANKKVKSIPNTRGMLEIKGIDIEDDEEEDYDTIRSFSVGKLKKKRKGSKCACLIF